MEEESSERLLALAIAPKVTAPFSIVGSLFILTDVLGSREKLRRTYCRLVLMISIFDICSSTAAFFSTWPVPKGTPGVSSALGTTATCTAQGFFVQLGIGAPFYNTSLAIYYFLVIAYSYSDDKVKHMEWLLHSIPVFFAVGFAVAAIPLTLYNPAGIWCSIASLPATCTNSRDGDEQCIRGAHAWIYQWAFFSAPVWFCLFVTGVSMIIVCYLAWAKDLASRRFQFEHRSNNNSQNDRGQNSRKLQLSWIFSKREKKETKRPSLASQVGWQAFFYLLGFVIPWIPKTVSTMEDVTGSGQPIPYSVRVACALLYPMQGFFNFLVYIRPRIVKYRTKNPDKTLCAVTTRAISRTWKCCGRVFGTLDSMNNNISNNITDESDAEDAAIMDPSYAFMVDQRTEDPAHEFQVKTNDDAIRNANKSYNLQERASAVEHDSSRVAFADRNSDSDHDEHNDSTS